MLLSRREMIRRRDVEIRKRMIEGPLTNIDSQSRPYSNGGLIMDSVAPCCVVFSVSHRGMKRLLSVSPHVNGLMYPISSGRVVKSIYILWCNERNVYKRMYSEEVGLISLPDRVKM